MRLKNRRVVLVSLTDKGKKAFRQHAKFHQDMIQAAVTRLNEEEKQVLQKALTDLNLFFRSWQS